MKFSNTITIDRQPAEVFAFLAQLENLPRWNYAISETRKITPGPVGIGSTYAQIRMLPTASTESLEITAYLLDQTLSVRGGFGPMSGTATYLLEPIGTSTRLTNVMDLEPSGILAIVALFTSAQIKSAVSANLSVLKGIVEGL